MTVPIHMRDPLQRIHVRRQSLHPSSLSKDICAHSEDQCHLNQYLHCFGLSYYILYHWYLHLRLSLLSEGEDMESINHRRTLLES